MNNNIYPLSEKISVGDITTVLPTETYVHIISRPLPKSTSLSGDVLTLLACQDSTLDFGRFTICLTPNLTTPDLCTLNSVDKKVTDQHRVEIYTLNYTLLLNLPYTLPYT